MSSGNKAYSGKQPPPVQLQASRGQLPQQEDLQIAMANRGHDWTPDQRAGLNLGDQLGPDLNRRVPAGRQAELRQYARDLMDRYSDKPNPTHPNRPGPTYLDFVDFSAMLDEIVDHDSNTVEKVVIWNHIGIYARDYGIRNRGLHEDFHEPIAKWDSHKHIILPFTDDYHGHYGGAEGDENVDLSSVDPPHWIDLDNSDDRTWWNNLPNRDSMSHGPGKISEAYAEVLFRENRDSEIFRGRRIINGYLGAHRADAEASFATIENIRAFRWGGFSGFANSFDRQVRTYDY